MNWYCIAQAAGFSVRYGYLALVSSFNVAKKGISALSEEERAECCRLLIAQESVNDWLSCDLRGTKYRTGSQMILDGLYSTECEDARVYNVMGADVWEQYGSQADTIVVSRAGRSLPEEYPDHLFVAPGVEEAHLDQLSSTLVRTFYNDELEELERAVGGDVARHLKALHKLTTS